MKAKVERWLNGRQLALLTLRQLWEAAWDFRVGGLTGCFCRSAGRFGHDCTGI